MGPQIKDAPEKKDKISADALQCTEIKSSPVIIFQEEKNHSIKDKLFSSHLNKVSFIQRFNRHDEQG